MKLSGTFLKSVVLVSFTVLACSCFAQQFLIIEKAGRVRTEKLQVYDPLTFQLRDDPHGWYTRQILDMNVDAQLVLLGDTWIAVKDISRVKLTRQRTWAKLAGIALQGGGVSMLLGDLWFTLRGTPEFSDGGWEFGLVNIAVGTGIQALFAPIKYRLGDKKRLRVIDVTY